MSVKFSFIRNVGTLLTGTVLAQLCTILAAPVLSRLFSPEDFALYASFTTFTGFLLIICSGKFEQAMLVSENDRNVIDILLLSVVCCFFITILTPLFLYISSKFLIISKQLIEGKLVLQTTIFVFCGGLCEVFRVFFLTKKDFKIISSRTALGSFITVSLNLIFGFFFYKPGQLVFSSLIGQIISFLLFVFIFMKKNNHDFSFTNLNLKNSFIRYKKFPFLYTPSCLLNYLSGNLPIIIMSNYFESSDIGQYSFVYKIIALPMSIIGSSVQQVYLQRFSVEKQDLKKRLYVKTSTILFLSILLPAFVCCVYSQPLFKLIFGNQWDLAPFLAVCLAPMFVVQFGVSPVTAAVYIVEKKFRINLVLQIIRIVFVIFAFLFSLYFEFSFVDTIFAFSLTMVLYYLIDYLTALFVIRKGKID